VGELPADFAVLKEERRLREGDALQEALFWFMTPERGDCFETIDWSIVAVPIFFPMLLPPLRIFRDGALGAGSGTKTWSYKASVILATASDPSASSSLNKRVSG
jgi:hypothetical protein